LIWNRQIELKAEIQEQIPKISRPKPLSQLKGTRRGIST
jgi:hypothetical protein